MKSHRSQRKNGVVLTSIFTYLAGVAYQEPTNLFMTIIIINISSLTNLLKNLASISLSMTFYFNS